jgi:hypothetical protein
MIGATSPLERRCNTYDTSKCRSPTDCADRSLGRCHNCSCGKRVTKKFQTVSQTIGMSLAALLDYQLHPYHYSRRAHLFPNGHPLRMQFCQLLRHKHAAYELFFLHKSLWIGACFICESPFNVHDFHIWTQDNLLTIR